MLPPNMSLHINSPVELKYVAYVNAPANERYKAHYKNQHINVVYM